MEDTAPSTIKPKRHAYNLLRFLRYVLPQWALLLGGTVFGVGKFCLPIIGMYAIQVIIDVVLLTGENWSAVTRADLGLFGYVPWITLPATQTWLLTNILLTTAVMYTVLLAPCIYLRSVLTGRASHLSIFRMRYDLFKHIQRLSHRFFDTRQTGGIVSRMTSDVGLAQNLIGQAGTTLWIDLVSLSVYAAILLSKNVPLALVTFAVLPVYFILLARFKGPIKDTSRAVQQQLEEISGDLHERMGGISIVKAFAGERREARKFYSDTHRLLGLTMDNIKLSAWFNTLSNLVVTLAPLLVLYMGARQVLAGQLTTGELFFFMMMLGQFYTPLNQLTNLSIVFSNALAAIDRIFEMFDTAPDVDEHPTPHVPESVRGEVEFRDVSFTYNEERPALRDINLHVQAGEVIALVGPSGSGKSTFSKLIPRFYDPTHGQVLVDGRDIREWKIKTLRGSIGMVMQDTIVFNGTVRENLLYGNPKATDEQIIEATRMANAHEFISQLNDGYETIIGENGCQLSGGQRQRLSIARAFLCRPRILVLDEATASLDPHSEALVQEALVRLMTGRTTFIIAHRLATVVHADRLLVFQDGRIAETGSHKELLERGGLYAGLYNQQAKAMGVGVLQLRPSA